jgi:hypothetical protein
MTCADVITVGGQNATVSIWHRGSIWVTYKLNSNMVEVCRLLFLFGETGLILPF